MKYIIVFIGLVILSGCTTFTTNEHALRAACKSNVAEYDDGSLTFKCFDRFATPKEDRNK